MTRLEAIPGGKARRSTRGRRPPRLRAVTSPSSESSGRQTPFPRSAPQIMRTLNREHRYLASLLDVLEEQSDHLHLGETADFALLHDIMHYFVNYPDEHHHPREDVLFERLRLRDRASIHLIDQLESAHEQMSRHARKLLAALAEQRGKRGAATQELNRDLDQYVAYYRQHMDVEEGQVFPRAVARLRDEDWEVVNRLSRDLEDPLFGGNVRREYRRLSRILVERVDRAAEEVVIAEMFGIEALVESASVFVEGAVELNSSIRERVSAAWSDNLQDTAEALRRKDLVALLALPWRYTGNGLRHYFGVWQDSREILYRRAAELSEPFSSRYSYLRRALSKDWE